MFLEFVLSFSTTFVGLALLAPTTRREVTAFHNSTFNRVLVLVLVFVFMSVLHRTSALTVLALAFAECTDVHWVISSWMCLHFPAFCIDHTDDFCTHSMFRFLLSRDLPFFRWPISSGNFARGGILITSQLSKLTIREG